MQPEVGGSPIFGNEPLDSNNALFQGNQNHEREKGGRSYTTPVSSLEATPYSEGVRTSKSVKKGGAEELFMKGRKGGDSHFVLLKLAQGLDLRGGEKAPRKLHDNCEQMD